MFIQGAFEKTKNLSRFYIRLFKNIVKYYLNWIFS